MYLSIIDVPNNIDIDDLIQSLEIALLSVGINPDNCEMGFEVINAYDDTR